MFLVAACPSRSGLVAPGLALTCLLGLSACGPLLAESTADVAGIAGAGVAGAVTTSPVLGAGIGLGVRAAANAGLQRAEREVHGTEQDHIAQAAGILPVGVVGAWGVVHRFPIEPNEHGQVVVTRELGGGNFRCKEIVFSVDHPPRDGKVEREFYTATVCQDGTAWKWASAEPATSRWGALQ